MAKNGKKSVGESILDGIRNMSEKDWDRSVKQAEEAEAEGVRRMAERMKEDTDKKKADGVGEPTSEP